MRDRYETVEVPFLTIGNRRCLSCSQVEALPWLKDFLKQFSYCFEFDEYRQVFWYYAPEAA